ncbi:hypothetical protein [Opitutus terrae]|uniref:Uncharacterized protein n=1 Tax=Opitutus terrae (strain DSM 11246 / JCM 15787 / PB90-1) TaxID=452637 RepID=B1ZPD3_OPITP|nr:hypothetical protein [Opitutus terrae]ACB73538.1 hypothetical protein Oter_0247 [Opitutus terrae PB90-1]
MATLLARLNAALYHRRVGPSLVAALGLVYACAYLNHPLFPGTGEPALTRGWWTWTDQQRYLAEATAIAEARLDAATFHYPIGYPALGALFCSWLPANPFFIPDLLLVLAASFAWWRLAQRWLSRGEALAVGLAFIATHRWLIVYTQIVPWNTLATQAALLVGVWLAIAQTGPRRLWTLAGLASSSYLVRPIDAVAFTPLLVFAVMRLDDWRARLTHGIGGGAVIAMAVIGAGLINHGVFDAWRSPYEVVSAQAVGFFSYPISYKLYWLFVDGGTFFGEVEPALLFRYPWLVLALPGVIFWVRREGLAGAAGAAALGLNWLFYVNYNDLLPSDVYRFTLIHYLAWGFPLLFLLAVAACRHGWRDWWVRAGGAAAVALGVLAIGLRLEENPLRVERTEAGWRMPAERPLLIRFPNASAENVAELRVDGRALVEYSEYLVPYVSSDLQLLLGTRTAGTQLSVAPGSPLANAEPQVGHYVWCWRPALQRLRAVCR